MRAGAGAVRGTGTARVVEQALAALAEAPAGTRPANAAPAGAALVGNTARRNSTGHPWACGKLALGLAVLGLAAPGWSQDRAVRSGVTTHFSQGWPDRLMSDAAGLGATTIRDSVAWARVERAPGRFDFTPANSGHVSRACAAGMTVLLGLEPRNPLYDGGQTAWSPPAQAAFTRYVGALAGRWPGCVVAIEIGNEINGKGGIAGPAAQNRVAAHVSLLRAVYRAVKPGHPELVLLGGSVNTVATGFLARLFAAGALDWVDGIAVHPYRPEPEGLDDELARLRTTMRRYGPVRPIWATEFSRAFPDPDAAPGWQLKALALMESAGVANHYWYALADQPGFPTMGLIRFDGSAKSAGRAFAFAARWLAPLGPAQRVDHGDATLFHFRFGPTTHLVWGAPRALFAPPSARAFAADGAAIPLPAQIGATPVVIREAPALGFGPTPVLADSLYQFGEAPLAWLARRPGGEEIPLIPVDWEWTSYLGSPALPGFAANRQGIGTAAGAIGSTGTIVRYSAPAAVSGVVSVAVCLRPAAPGASARAALVGPRGALWQSPVGDQRATHAAVAVGTLARGEHVDLVLAAPANGSASRFHYRLIVARGAAEAPSC